MEYSRVIKIPEGKKIAEGKTKILIQDPLNFNQIYFVSKRLLTKKDGKERLLLEDKDVFSNETTCNVFSYLNAIGVQTHFIGKVDERTFLGHKVKMIPVEIVTRRIAFGSYLERNPGISRGKVFQELIVEFFFKDDSIHDPLMIWDETGKRFYLYNAHMAISKKSHCGFLEAQNIIGLSRTKEHRFLCYLAKQVFLSLEKAWQAQDVMLVDLKIECGIDEASGKLVVADVIDNDSWRIWPKGDMKFMKDKQVFRDMDEVTPEREKILKENYAWVAEATKKFLFI